MPIPNDEFFRDLQAMRHDWLLRTGRQPGRGQPPREAPREIYVVNESGEEVPAFGVMQVLGVNDRTSSARFNYLRIEKPDGTGSAFLVNGPRPLPAIASGVTGRGIAFRDGEALYDTADGTPAAGETWGPDDDWKLHKDQPGFEILGGANASSGTAYAWAKSQVLKPYIDFSLDEALATSDADADATIEVQYGPGRANDDTSITVLNLNNGSGVYLFEGATETWGRAVHHEGQEYLILNMHCPE